MCEDLQKIEVKTPLWMSEGLLVVWVPIAFYFLTYCYEQAYITALGVPVAFIQVGPQQMISFVFSFSTSWYMLIVLAGFLIESKHVPSKISPAKWSYFFLIIFGLLLTNIYADSIFGYRTLVIAGIILCILGLDFLLSHFSTEKTLKGLYAFIPDNVLKDASEKPVELLLYKLVFITGIGFIISTASGQHAAKSQEFFPVYQADSTLFLIYGTDTRTICGSFDPFTRRVNNGITILPISDKQPTSFVNRKIGPFKFKTSL
jgi:hypothetical protein